jgi:3-oxoacyl-[acyl-carrier protein] reductase
MGRMQNRVAIVTGASSGIGRAIALAYAREGGRVFVTGLEDDLTARTVGEIRDAGGEAHGLAADLGDLASAERIVEGAVAEFGGVDTLVNAAGDPASARERDGALDRTDPEYWDHMYRVTLRSAMAMTKATLPRLRASDQGGRVIFIGSVMAERGGAWDVYAPMKGALNGLTRSMAVSCGADRVTVNCLAVGSVVVEKTAAAWQEPARQQFWQRHAITRVGQPEDIAHCCLWLGADEGEYVTGAIIAVDGGMAARGI